MKMSEIKDLTLVELTAKSRDLRQEMFNLRLQQASSQLEKPARLRTLRRDIARIETQISQCATTPEGGLMIVMAETQILQSELAAIAKNAWAKSISNKMAKTIVVRVERRFPHPQVQESRHALTTNFTRTMKRAKPRSAIACVIEETRPLSKTEALAAGGGGGTQQQTLRRWRLK